MKRGDPIAELRSAIDRLPVDTRRAMLDGVRAHPIIVGAYVDSDGGICPMLAAHRHGGRTTFLPFAQAWDRLGGTRRARRATRRELHILTAQLEASLRAPEPADLGAAIAEHRALTGRHADEIRAARLFASGTRGRADAAGALAHLEHELDRS